MALKDSDNWVLLSTSSCCLLWLLKTSMSSFLIPVRLTGKTCVLTTRHGHCPLWALDSTEWPYSSLPLLGSTFTAPERLLKLLQNTFLYFFEGNMGSPWGYSWKEPVEQSVWNRPSSDCFLQNKGASIHPCPWVKSPISTSRARIVFTHPTRSESQILELLMY